jgi:HME family heavy-metal exporter
MFKWLLDNSLTNRLLVIIASVVLMAYGAFTLSRTPVDVFPDLNKPTVTIMTEAGGMAAEEVEQLITFPLETTMNGLPGVESVRSVSSRRPVLHLRHLRLEHRHLPRPADGVGAPVVDGGRACRRRGAAHGADQLDHGRDHADRHPHRHEQDQPDGRARVRRLGAAPAPAGDPRRGAGDPHRRRGAPVPGAAEHRRAWRSWASRTTSWKGALKGFASNTSGGFLELNGPRIPDPQPGPHLALEDLKNLALTAKQRPARPAAPGRRR